MQNSPINNTFAFDDTTVEHELIAPGNPSRLLIVAMLFLVTTVIILARIAWVQTMLPDRFLSYLEATTTEYELIPARDGRILTEDRVLAVDVEQYSVQVHYRWIQEPPEPEWIRQRIHQRLSREERRDETLVNRTEQAILTERQQLWERLALRTGLAAGELDERRRQIQLQVERIAESVNQRYRNRTAPFVENDSDAGYFADSGWLMQIASGIRRALTTVPDRNGGRGIVVREQETWHTIVGNVGLTPAAYISEHPEQFPGTRTLSTTQRTYPEHQLAAHLIGARTKVRNHEQPATEIPQPAGAPESETRRGRFGIEMQYDGQLQGVPGLLTIVRNRRQQVVSTTVTRKPQSGRDVSLTIDCRLQHLCEQLLAESLTDVPRNLLSHGRQTSDDDAAQAEQSLSGLAAASPQPVPTGGSVVVIEAASGRILAAASAPGFDLRLFTDGSTDAWDAVNADHRRPFISRFSSMALPPGSTFKTVTAVAGLHSGAIDSDGLFHCQGFLRNPDEHRCLIFRNFGHGHGRVNLKRALAESCNVYFFDAAQRMGIIPLNDWTSRLGFGAPTGVDLPFEKSGTILRTSADFENPENARDGLVIADMNRRFRREALGLSIGQSRLSVTPLQMARMMAAIANGGWLVTPHVVTDEGASHRASELHLLKETDDRLPRMRIPELTDDMILAVRNGLIAAVEEPYGTGYKTVRLDHVQIGGKSGTAEASPGKPDHAWFTGFAPADDPEYVFVVVLEHGGSGSHAAGPIAREVVRWLFPDRDAGQLSARE